MIGETVRRSIPIVNRSILPVTVTPSLRPKAPDCQDISVLRLLTTSQMTLPPPKQQGRRKVEQLTKISLAFSPKKRMKQFIEEVSLSGLHKFINCSCTYRITVLRTGNFFNSLNCWNKRELIPCTGDMELAKPL